MDIRGERERVKRLQKNKHDDLFEAYKATAVSHTVETSATHSKDDATSALQMFIQNQTSKVSKVDILKFC